MSNLTKNEMPLTTTVNKKMHRYWLKKYLLTLKKQNHSPHTIINYAADLKKFLWWLEACEFQKIQNTKPTHISKFIDVISTGEAHQKKSFLKLKFKIKIFKINRLSVASKKRHLSTIKNFFEFLSQSAPSELPWWRKNWFKNNPVKPKLHGLRLKDEDVTPTSVLNFANWEKLKESCWRANERFMVSLMYYGGLRVDELRRLKWRDFDPASESLELIRKGGKRHTLFFYWPKEVFHLFESLRPNENLDEVIFQSNRKTPFTTRSLHRKVTSIIKKSGMPASITPHSFRKGCATRLYIQTKDLLYVRDYLNHTDAKVTQSYIDRKVLEAERKIKREENTL